MCRGKNGTGRTKGIPCWLEARVVSRKIHWDVDRRAQFDTGHSPFFLPSSRSNHPSFSSTCLERRQLGLRCVVERRWVKDGVYSNTLTSDPATQNNAIFVERAAEVEFCATFWMSSQEVG